MKKYIKEIVILVIQLLVFYLFPLLSGPSGEMGMIMLMVLATMMLSVVLGSVSKYKIKFLYPVVIALLFIPSVFLYYNESALIHALWYLAASAIGLGLGIITQKMGSK